MTSAYGQTMIDESTIPIDRRALAVLRGALEESPTADWAVVRASQLTVRAAPGGEERT